MINACCPRYKLKEKPLDESFMKIQTHVLTNPQDLDAGRQQTARGNIGAASQDDLTALGNVVGNKVDKEPGKSLSTIVSADVSDDGKVLTLHTTDGNLDFSGGEAAIESISQNGQPIAPVGKNVEITETIQSISVNNVQQTIDDNHNVNITIETPVSPSATNPLMDGEASPGSSAAYSRGDHVHPSDTSKADKVKNAVNGNFAGLTSSGNLTDSYYNHESFATAAQGAKADSAYQLPSGGIPKTDLDSSVQASLGKADTALQAADVVGKANKDEMAITAVDGDTTKKNIQLKNGNTKTFRVRLTRYLVGVCPRITFRTSIKTKSTRIRPLVTLTTIKMYWMRLRLRSLPMTRQSLTALKLALK